MTKVYIEVSGAEIASVRKEGLLTTGMVGATVVFTFDASWDGRSKVAVFRGSGVTKDVAMVGDVAQIPPEVLERSGALSIGVEGYGTDGVIVPTVWAGSLAVLEGANASGDPSTDPTLPVWGQIQVKVGDLEKLETVDKSSLVAAINEALSKGGGTVDEAAVERIVEEYLAAHPSEPGDPSADGGYYTPIVSQDEAGTVTFGWSASQAGMPEVEPEKVELPAGPKGDPGADGQDGADGYTPVKGVDYFTPEECQELAEAAAGMVEAPSGGGSETWQLLHDFELTEEVSATTGMEFDTSGAKEIIVEWYCPKLESNCGYAKFQLNGNSPGGGVFSSQPYFWSGKLTGTSACYRTFRIEALGDCAVISLMDDNNTNTNVHWWEGEGLYKTIDRIALIHYSGTYPVGLKIRIWGRV